MKCPACSYRLSHVKTRTSLLDFCPVCRGIWFDSGELADFVKALVESQNVPFEQTRLFRRRQVRALHTIKEKDRACPKCRRRLRKFNYAYDSNVILDRCPACGGIWTDAGEAKAIAAYVKEDPKVTEIARWIAESTASPEPEPDVGAIAFFPFLPRIIVPVSDDTPRQRFPLITVLIIGLYALSFLVRLLISPSYAARILDAVPRHIFSVDLLASMFAHKGPFPFIWNVLFLWLFGDNVEDRFSRLGYLVFFACCGVFAALLYGIFGSHLPLAGVGVSGAVSGVMGAYLIFYPVANIKIFVIFDTVEVPAFACLIVWFVLQFIYPFLPGGASATVLVCLTNAAAFMLGAFIACLKKRATIAGR